ncbi:MAG: phosphotransferase enzyme family protein [Candidatus Thorarchaeota archaeon]
MSSASEISYHAFLLRLRKLAEKALEAYGLEGARLRFINFSGNGLYQVQVSDKQRSNFAPGRYALRLHQPNYMTPEYISSELEWLAALNHERIGVPQPFRTLDGNWIATVDGGYEVPTKRNCTLIGWTEGRLLNKGLRSRHFNSLGRIVGRMHGQSRNWKKPPKFKRPHWDWEGLFGDGFDYGFSASEAREAIPKNHQDSFNDLLQRVQEASDQMGRGRNVYGLIHADLSFDANVAIHEGEARPFDFDDCGFGYWMFDLGVVLAHYMVDTDGEIPEMQDALIEGYMETSPLPESNLDNLDLFIGARCAQIMLFNQGGALRNPTIQEEARREIELYGRWLKHILKRMK